MSIIDNGIRWAESYRAGELAIRGARHVLHTTSEFAKLTGFCVLAALFYFGVQSIPTRHVVCTDVTQKAAPPISGMPTVLDNTGKHKR